MGFQRLTLSTNHERCRKPGTVVAALASIQTQLAAIKAEKKTLLKQSAESLPYVFLYRVRLG